MEIEVKNHDKEEPLLPLFVTFPYCSMLFSKLTKKYTIKNLIISYTTYYFIYYILLYIEKMI